MRRLALTALRAAGRECLPVNSTPSEAGEAQPMRLSTGRRTHGSVGPRHRPRSAGSARGWPQRSRLPGARARCSRGHESSAGWVRIRAAHGEQGHGQAEAAPPTRRAASVGTTYRPRVVQCQRRGSARITAALLRRLRGRSGGALGSAAASTSGRRSSPRWLDSVPRPRGQQLAKRGGPASALASKSHIGRWRFSCNGRHRLVHACMPSK